MPKKRKKGGGRKDKSGPKTSLNPQREQATDIRAKLLHGRLGWRMMRLQALLRKLEKALIREQEKASRKVRKGKSDPKASHEAKLRFTDNYLSGRAAAFHGALQVAPPRQRYLLLDEVDTLWREVATEFERAVVHGDANWFVRQANVIRFGDTRAESDKARDRFEAAVARELEHCFWENRAKKRKPEMQDATLEPAGKRTGVTEQLILDRLEQRTEGRHLFVEGCRFESARRAREEIKKLARLQGYK